MSNPKNEKLHDLTPRELVTFIPLVMMAFWIGLYPKPFFQILEQPVNQIVRNARPDYPLGKAVVASETPVPAAVPAASKAGKTAPLTAAKTPAKKNKPKAAGERRR